MIKNQKLSYIYAVIAVFFWSTVATAFKVSLSYVSSFTLLFYASLFSFTILFFILLFSKDRKIFSRKQILYSAFLGFINPFAYYLILFKAYDLLEAQIAQPLNYTWPIVLSIFSIFFLNQKFKMKLLFSILLSFTGVILLSFSQASLSANFDFFGIFLALASAFVWATYWILNVKRKYPVFEGLFLNFFFGTIYSFILLLIIGNPINIPVVSLLPLIYVGAFEMSVTFIFWFKALSYSENTSKTSNLIYISPFISLIFIHYILGEKINMSTLYGITFIVIGILIQSINKKGEKYEKT